MSDGKALAPLVLDRSVSMVRNAVHSKHSKRSYGTAVGHFLSWYATRGVPPLSKAVFLEYRAALEESGLAPSSINVRMSAIRKLMGELADNGLVAPEWAAGIAKVGGIPRLGRRIGRWLSPAEAELLLKLPDRSTVKGLRDRALLAVLLGAGLRRSEASALTFERLQQRDGRWVIADLEGKHRRIRTVPIPDWCKAAIDDWAGGSGRSRGWIFTTVRRGNRVGETQLTPHAMFQVIKGYGAKLGLDLAPHDLRRTFAKLAHKGQAGLEQIQLSLGHASVVTTEAYLGVRQDLGDAPCDHLGLQVETHGPERNDL